MRKRAVMHDRIKISEVDHERNIATWIVIDIEYTNTSFHKSENSYISIR